MTKQEEYYNYVSKWQTKLGLTDWKISLEEIASDQVMYDSDCPEEDKYFVGIEIDHQNNKGIIYYDIDIKEIFIIHELLHVKYPEQNEEWINQVQDLLYSIPD